MLHVGVAVRLLRLAQGLTIIDLAQLAHLDKMTVSDVESGRDHKRSSLEKLGLALGCGGATGLEERLHAWCVQVVGPRRVSPDVREIVTAWMSVAADARFQQVILAIVRQYAQLLRELSHWQSFEPPTHDTPRGRAVKGRAGSLQTGAARATSTKSTKGAKARASAEVSAPMSVPPRWMKGAENSWQDPPVMETGKRKR